jgi:hypothetical protein
MTFNLGVVHKRHPHLLADMAELTLVARYDQIEELSQAKLEQLIKELPGAQEELAANEGDADQHAVDQHESTDRHVEDCWAQLEYRQSVFGHYYPFEVISTSLRWRPGLRTSKHCLYTFLLVCSRLRSFEISGFPQRAAKVFEQISKVALEELSGPGAKVRIFDANSNDRQYHYGTDLRVAMRKLAAELGAHFVSEEEIDKLSPGGDFGLDLVSVHDFSDGAKGAVSMFGQCGAQETGWPKKTLEAHPKRFIGLFSCLHEPANVMFIPLCFRDTSGAWVADYKVSGCYLIDRLRILSLTEKRWAQAESQVELNCYPILKEVISLAG